MELILFNEGEDTTSPLNGYKLPKQNILAPTTILSSATG